MSFAPGARAHLGRVVTRRLKLLAVAAATALGGGGVTATPASAVYASTFVDQCCYLTLEPGDRAEQFLALRNTGDQVWYRGGAIPVRLGASNPHDRSSPFFTAGDWISPGRPTDLDEVSVAPGEVGRFTWIATAPTTPGVYTEYYNALAEGVDWIPPDNGLYLVYTVIAAQAPVLRITASPARVRRGDAITVSADATDNRAVAKVTFSVGTQAVTVEKPTQGTSGYTATLNSADLGAGTQSVKVTAVDVGGRESSALSAFEVYEAPVVIGPSTRLGPFTPLFATRTARGRLGSLIGLGEVRGLRAGSQLRIVCTRACVRRLNITRTASSSGRVRAVTFRRAQRLLRRTLIELRSSAPGYVTRFQRYRFRRTRTATLARFVSSGCLASEKPRVVRRCPP